MTIATRSGASEALRWRIPVVLAVTVFVNYLDRNNLAIALPRIGDDFGWSENDLANNGQYLLAAFFLAYGLSNMLLSPAAERFGPKKSVIAAIVAFSICTILSAPFGQILAALIVLRLLLGLGEGVHFPMLSTITSQWFRPSERSRANAIWDVGVLLATATAPLMLVPLIDSIGWQSTFAILGAIGLIISVPLVWFFVQENPHPVETATEVPTVQEEVAVAQTASYTRNKYFWLMVVGGILNAFCVFGVLNWLPSYFNKARNIDFDKLGWPLALVFSSGILGVIVLAVVGDWLNRRILLASGGFILAGSMVPLAAASKDINFVVLFMAIGVFCQSAYTASEFAIVQRFLPANKIGAGTGLYNGLTVLFGGVGGSFIPGTLVSITGDFTAGLIGVMVGAFLAGIVYFFLSRAVKY